MTWLPQSNRPRPAESDEQAMRQLQLHGDHDAFARVVARWEAPIRRLCIRMTCDEHRGEDLAQETLARVFAKRSQFEPGRKFSTWLWRIALNLCFEEGRRAARMPPRDDDSLADEPASRELSPDDHALAEERAAEVKRALAQLSHDHRSVVVLREYEGLKYREIADVLEIPEGTVKWRMAEALTQLGERLQALAPHEEPPRRPLPIL